MDEELAPGRAIGQGAQPRAGSETGRTRRRLIAGGAAGLAVLLLAVAAALLAGRDVLVRKVLEAKLHRSVSFSRLTVGGAADGLRLTFSDLRVGQPVRFGPGDLVRAPRLELTLHPLPLLAGRLEAPQVVVTAPDLHLRRHGPGDDNWTFGHGGGASSLLGATRRLEIRDGRVSMEDTALALTLQASVSHAPAEGALPLRLEGGGVLKGEAYRVVARGGPLNGRRPGTPHRIDIALVDGATHVRMQGVTQAPFDFRGLDADVAVDGPNLADLAYLFQLLAPNSPPYRLTTHMHRQGRTFEASRIDARLGDSDVEGVIRSDHKAHRTITAVLRSRRLTAHDLRILLASPPPHGLTRSTPGVSGRGVTPPGYVFSRTPVSLRRLRGVDAALDYDVGSATGFGPAVSDARLRLRLAGGRLAFTPLTFAMAGGTVRADYSLDTAPARPVVALGLRAHGLQVAGLQRRGGFSGRLDADLDLRGGGGSLAQQAAAAGGRASLRVRGGAMPEVKAAALGGDVFGLLAGALAPRARSPLRCAAADFTVRGGVAEATRLTVSTGEGSASGGGRIDLARERVDLTLKALPGGGLKLSTPITVTGPLAKPKVSAQIASARPILSGVVGAVRRLVGAAPARPPAAVC